MSFTFRNNKEFFRCNSLACPKDKGECEETGAVPLLSSVDWEEEEEE